MARRELPQKQPVYLSEPQERLARSVSTLLERHYHLSPRDAFVEASAMVATVARSVYDRRGVPLFYDNEQLSRTYTGQDRSRLEESLRGSWQFVYDVQRSQGFGRPQADAIARNFYSSQRFIPGMVPVRTERQAPARTHHYQVRVSELSGPTRTYRISSPQPLRESRLGGFSQDALLRLPADARITEAGRPLSVGQFIQRLPNEGDPLAGMIEIREVRIRPRKRT